MSFFGNGETVVHKAHMAGEVDDYGSPVDTWSEGVEVEGVGLDVQTAQEVAGTGVVSTSIVGMTAFMPSDWQGGARDRIVARGETYEIDGQPVPARNAFTGDTLGIVANLKRVTG